MKSKVPRHYSYRVDHDHGFAPHTWRNIASVCGCKPTTIELWAVKGSWIIGIGGKGTGKSDKLIYAMKVTESLTYANFRRTKPGAAAYLAQLAFRDEVPVLISNGEFYYFGDHALSIPTELRQLIHPTQGCKRISDRDIELLKARLLGNLKKGKHGRPNNGQSSSC